MNVSKHALKSYAKRIKEIQESDVLSSIAVNSERYKEEINKMFDNAKFIYQGRFNEKHNNTKYYLSDDICIVVSADDTNIITLYRVDFGFGRVVNKTIQDELVKELEKKDEIYNDIKSKTEESILDLMYQRDMLDSEIESLKKSIEALEDNRNGLNTYIESFGAEEKIAKEERDLVAKKIAYSVIYRKALEDNIK